MQLQLKSAAELAHSLLNVILYRQGGLMWRHSHLMKSLKKGRSYYQIFVNTIAAGEHESNGGTQLKMINESA